MTMKNIRTILTIMLAVIVLGTNIMSPITVAASSQETEKSTEEEITTKGYWSTENAPEFYGTTKIVLNVNDVFDLQDTRYRIFAKDFEDSDLTHQIIAKHNVDTSTAGSYEINYSVTDSHNNTTTLTVPVIVSDDVSVKPMIERTMYSLPSVDNISAMGIARGDTHDRQMMGIFVEANSSIEVRKTSGGTATFTMLNNDSVTEKTVTIDTSWQEINFEHDYVPFVKTLRKQTEKLVLEIRWDHEEQGVKELNYLLDGDDETAFQQKWNADEGAYAVLEGEALTVLVPYSDRTKLLNYYRYHHKTYAGFFAYWKQVTDTYDKMLGLEYKTDDVANQNSKSRFFVKANAHGAGAAYYAGDHVGINNSSVASFFEFNWGGLHEFGHGYQGSLGKGDLDIGEVSNNIFGYYIQTNKEIYTYPGNWLGELSAIEEGHNQKKKDGTAYKNLDVSAKLYFIINMLDSFEGPETYAKIATLYRKNILSGVTMDTQDAWALGIYESYGVNILPYFEDWGLKVADSTKVTIERNSKTNVYALKDIVKDESTLSQIKSELGIDLNYALVSNQQLASYSIKGDATVTIAIDDISKLKGKYVQLKDGSTTVAKAKIEGNEIVFKEVPVGAYEIQVPRLVGFYEQTSSHIVITDINQNTAKVTYTNLTGQIENDVRIQFTGNYFNDACVITLRSQDGEMNLHFEYRPRGLPNAWMGTEENYIRIVVHNASGEEVYEKVVKGKGYFTLQNLETYDLPVKEGDILSIMSMHGGSRVKFYSTLNGDHRNNYGLSDGIEGKYEITSQGLKPVSMSKEEFTANEYLPRLITYMDKFIATVEEEDIYDFYKYLTEKGIIVRGYGQLDEENQEKYLWLYQAITKGYVPTIEVKEKSIQLEYNQEIDLYQLINVYDKEDGVLGKDWITISFEYDEKEPTFCRIFFEVSDSDGNIVCESIEVEILNVPTLPPATATPQPTEIPATATPQPTEIPATATPQPTESPSTATPQPTEIPSTATPQPTESPVTATPQPTESPSTATPQPTESPSTATPQPTEIPATATPQPTKTPATATPQPTKKPTSDKVTVKKVTGLKQKEGSTSQVKLAWNKVSGATGYEIYQYHTKDKKYVMIGTTTTTSKTIGGLKPGTSYSFKVRAYKKVKGKNYYGATSSALTATTKLQRPIILSVRSKSKKAISIMLKKAPSVSGYQISVSTSKDFKNSTTMNRTTKKTTYLVTNLKSKKKYYVKVRVYKTVNNKKIFSDWSPVKAINVR